jgi:hypothetical protein
MALLTHYGAAMQHDARFRDNQSRARDYFAAALKVWFPADLF